MIYFFVFALPGDRPSQPFQMLACYFLLVLSPHPADFKPKMGLMSFFVVFCSTEQNASLLAFHRTKYNKQETVEALGLLRSFVSMLAV